MKKGQANAKPATNPCPSFSAAQLTNLWICTFRLGWQFVLQPVFVWAVAVSGSDLVIPIIPTEGLMSLTLSFLVLGAMRSAEKFKGKARENMRRTQ